MGTLILNTSFTEIAQSDANLHIGNEGGNNTGQYLGQIDEVEIYN